MNSSNLTIPILIASVGPLTWTASAAGPNRPDALVQAAKNAREIIAHRGSMIDRPENTLASYRRAIEVGATVTECDVRTTKDGVLVSLHDLDIRRTSNGKGRLSDQTLAELRELDFGSWFTARGVAFKEKADHDAKGRTIYLLENCPFNHDHRSPDAAIMEAPDGAQRSGPASRRSADRSLRRPAAPIVPDGGWTYRLQRGTGPHRRRQPVQPPAARRTGQRRRVPVLGRRAALHATCRRTLISCHTVRWHL
jgi:hypothetical protein